MQSLHHPLRITYKTIGGVDIPTDIHLPPPAARPAPVLLMIHGGAFMLGHAGMNNKDQIVDCLARDWIVLSLEHRLCPGVDILQGPMTDVRDALKWVQNGGLAQALEQRDVKNITPDADRVMVMGTSSGGHLALCTGFDVPKPPLAILDFYGAKCFDDAFWSQRMPNMPEHFYPARPDDEIAALRRETTTFIGGASLEGHTNTSPTTDPKVRQAFAMYAIANGKVIDTIRGSYQNKDIDPYLNFRSDWPPTAFVHGTADTMIPMRISKEVWAKLKDLGVETEFVEVEGEPHTFCGQMKLGSKTWETQRKGFDFLERILKRSY